MAELVAYLSMVPHMRFSTFDVPPTSAPLTRGFFCAARIILVRLRGRGLGHNARLGMARHALNVLPEKRGWSPSNAKGPVSDDGAFRTFLRWQGMLSDPANFSIRHAPIWFQGPPLLALRARCWPPGARLPQAQTVAPITSEQIDQMGSGCCFSYLGGPPTSRGEADREGACKSMNHALTTTVLR